MRKIRDLMNQIKKDHELPPPPPIVSTAAFSSIIDEIATDLSMQVYGPSEDSILCRFIQFLNKAEVPKCIPAQYIQK